MSGQLWSKLQRWTSIPYNRINYRQIKDFIIINKTMKELKKPLSQRGKSLLEMIQIQKDKEKSEIYNYIYQLYTNQTFLHD